MKKAIVTGANGFIGSALCKELVSQGVKVIAVVRSNKSRLDAIEGLQAMSVVYADLSEFYNLPNIIKDRDIDVFFHLAWEGSSDMKRGDDRVQIHNVLFTCDAVKACQSMGIGRFVFSSSIMEYEVEAIMKCEKAPDVYTLYASAKLAANYMARAIAGSQGVEYIRAVISNVYGPGEVSPRLVNASIRKLLSGVRCSFSNGEQMYDFIYIDDAVKAISSIGETGKANKTYYIGSGNPHKLKDYLLEINRQIAPDIEQGFGEIPFNGVSLKYDEFDMDAVKKDTGIIPKVSFQEGINQTISWMKSEK